MQKCVMTDCKWFEYKLDEAHIPMPPCAYCENLQKDNYYEPKRKTEEKQKWI